MLLNEKINHVINLPAVSLAKNNQCLNYSNRSGNVLMVVHCFYYYIGMYIVSQFSFCKFELFPSPNLLFKKKLSACCIKFFKIWP